MVDVSDELSQILNTQVLYVDTVDEHFALLHVIIARNQVNHRRFATAALSDDGNRLSFLYREVDVAQNPLFTVSERYVLKLYLMVKTVDMLRLGRFLDGVFCHENLVNTFHGSQAFRNVVTSLRELFQWVDDAIENHHIIDKRRTRNGLVV